MFILLGGRYRAALLGTVIVLALFCILRLQYSDSVIRVAPWRYSAPSNDEPLANATLGFGAIIANSVENQDDPRAWRRRGLIAAANRTGIQINIPPPIPTNETALDILRTVGNGPYPKPGSAKAFYAHLGRLEEFLESGLETVLLLEDDVDWELDIRKILAPQAGIATGIRNATLSHDDPNVYPYGMEWDLLWLGHCGFQTRSWDKTYIVQDQDTISTDWMKSIFGSGVHKKLAENTREIHTRMAAMCTFGIGVTRDWARLMLDHAYKGGTKGADYSTHLQCGREGLRCIGLRPEIMHQQKAVGGGYATEIEKVNKAIAAKENPFAEVDESTEEEADEVHFFTFNLKYSARCNIDRPDDKRVMCPPTKQEWEKYNS